MPVPILSYETTLLENKTFDYNHRIKYIQYSDGDVFDIFYTCSEPDEPLLMLETRKVWEDKMKPTASAYYYTDDQIPLENPQDRNLCSVSFIDDFSWPFVFTLYPTNCTGNFYQVFEFENKTMTNTNQTCTLLGGYGFPEYDTYDFEFSPAWTYVYIYDEEYFMFLVRPPLLTLKSKKNKHLLEVDFNDLGHPTVHAAYHAQQLCCKIEREVNGVWEEIYEGDIKHAYVVRDVEREHTVKYRAFMRNCKDLKEFGRKIWSNASDVLTVHFNFTTSANETALGVGELEISGSLGVLGLDFKKYVIVLASVVSVVLLAALSYFMCHRKLGVCDACGESVPAPKIFVQMDRGEAQSKCFRLENETKIKESSGEDFKVWRSSREDHEEIQPCLLEDGSSGYIVNEESEVLLRDRYISDITNMQEIKSIMKDRKNSNF